MNIKNLMKGGLIPFLLTTALLFGVTSAHAAGNEIPLGNNSVWTVYAFGNAQAVADAFRAMHNFSQSDVFRNIFTLIAVLGILAIGIGSGFNSAVAKRFVGYCVGAFMVSYVFFGVNNDGPLVVRVEVIDTVDNTWKAPVTVPAVVGIPAAIISTAGYEITRQIEASFPIPDELKMSNGAPFNLAAALIADASQARISDPNISQSMAYYVQDCFTIGVGSGYINGNVLLNSTEFLKDLKLSHPGVMVSTLLKPTEIGMNNVASCTDAHTYLTTAIDAIPGGAAAFLKSASAWTKTPALSVINSALDKTISYATNNGSSDGGSAVKQAAMLSVFKDSYRNTAATTGNNELITAMAITQATETQRTSWIVGAEVFNRMMGYVFAVIQVFVYAVTPLVMLMALVPGLGAALLKNFLQIVLWLAMWQPMLAVVNFIILSMQQSELGGALGASGTFTMTNMSLTTEKSANMRAAATFVGTMVPALSWAMVKGSVDFSRVIGSAVGENYAQQAANTMTTGNFSLNQGSMDSFTANKSSIAATSDNGNGMRVSDGVMSREINNGGTNAKVNGQGASLNVTNSQQIGGQGSTGKQGNDVLGGSSAANRTVSGNYGQNAGAGHTTSSNDSQLRSTTVQGGVSGSGGIQYAPGAGGGGTGGGNTTGPNQPGVQNLPPAQTVQLDSKGLPIKPTAGAQLSGGVTVAGQTANQRVESDGKNWQQTAALQTSGQRTDGSTDSKTIANNAAESLGYNDGSGMAGSVSATGAASVEFNQRFSTSGSFATRGYRSIAGNDGGPAPVASNPYDAQQFQADFAGRKAQVSGDLAKLDAAAHKAHDTGEAAADKALATARAREAKLRGDANGGVLDPSKGAGGLMVSELKTSPLAKRAEEAGAFIGKMLSPDAENLNPEALAKHQQFLKDNGLDQAAFHPKAQGTTGPAPGVDPAPAPGTTAAPAAAKPGAQVVAQAAPLPQPPQPMTQGQTPEARVEPPVLVPAPTQVAQAGDQSQPRSLADNLTAPAQGSESREMQGQVLMAERRAEQAERTTKEAGAQTHVIAEAQTLDQAQTENRQLQAILKA